MEHGSARFYVSEAWGKDWPSDYRGYRLLEIVAEDDRVKLVPYSDAHFDLHFKIRLELYPVMTKILAAHEGMKADCRRMISEESPDLKILVFDNVENRLVGEVVAQPPADGVIELGWDILPDCQRRGYATGAARLLMEMLMKRSDCTGFRAVVEAGNTASKALCRKLGGVPRAVEELIVARAFGEDSARRFEVEHRGLITDEVAEEARIFGVEPEKLLTHALVFSIPASS